MKRFEAKIIGYLFISVIGIFLIQGCSKNKSTNSTPPPQHSANYHAVSIQNFAFSPADLTIPVGDTVAWTNNDGTTHTVTSDTGSELAASLGAGQTYQHIFGATGSFAYHCTIHPNMHGSVTVQ